MPKKIEILCVQCKQISEVWNHGSTKFCSRKCTNDYKYDIWKEAWLKGNDDGSSLNKNHLPSKRIKRYFKENVYECEECGQGKIWNNKSLTLEVDHIDGNRSNNFKSNLRYLCPNCHSQTPTFRNKTRLL